MKRVVQWIWDRGIVSAFLTGLFVILPIVVTVAIMSWVGSLLADWLGPESYVGRGLENVGARFIADPTVAMVLGWVIVLVAIWLLGVFAKSLGKNRLEQLFHAVVERIPLVNALYKPVVQVIDMFKKDGQNEMEGMSVVYCAFGRERGGGFLGLLVAPDVYRFSDQDYHVVYVPTSPVPMSGGILFVPKDSMQRIDMKVDDLMQIYFSIGVMSNKVIPQRYVAPAAAE